LNLQLQPKELAVRKPVLSDADLHPVLADRWSPRSFDADYEIPEEDVLAILEAARWAPSANNIQPWRFIVAHRGDENFLSLSATLAGFNSEWAPNASLFIAVSAYTSRPDGTPHFFGKYDAGLAAGFLTVEAHHRGYAVHQIGGFDRDQVKSEFAMDESLTPIVILAIGKQAAAAALASDTLREREAAPRERKALSELVLAGEFAGVNA
jgi:nitroreductase